MYAVHCCFNFTYLTDEPFYTFKTVSYNSNKKLKYSLHQSYSLHIYGNDIFAGRHVLSPLFFFTTMSGLLVYVAESVWMLKSQRILFSTILVGLCSRQIWGFKSMAYDPVHILAKSMLVIYLFV